MYKRDEALKRSKLLSNYYVRSKYSALSSKLLVSPLRIPNHQSQNFGPLLPSHIVATTLLPWSLGQDFPSD